MNVYRFAFKRVPVPVLYLNTDGQIRDANDATCALLGYPYATLLSRPVSALIPDWPAPGWSTLWQRLITETTQPIHLVLRDANGRALPVTAEPCPYRHDDRLEMILFLHRQLPAADAQRELERLNELIEVSESIAHIGHWRLPLATGKLQWSRQVFEIFRRDPASGEPSFEALAQYLRPSDWHRLRKALESCAHSAAPRALTLRIGRGDGSKGVIRLYGSALPQRDAETAELVGFIIDVSEQEDAKRQLLDAHRQLKIALEAGQIGVYRVNFKTGEASADPRYFAMLGYGANELTPTLAWWRQQIHPGDAGAAEAAIERCLTGGSDHLQVEYRMRHRNGHWVWIEDHAQLFERDQAGGSALTIGVHMDISQRKRAEQKLSFRANYDQLTRLPNRRSFWSTLRHIHAQSQRTQEPYCIAILDLDLFKSVNDKYGHQAGDRVLAGFAKRLRRSVREADWTARWGGEEFIVLMPKTDIAQAHRSMERLREVIAASPFTTIEHSLAITASIGISALIPTDRGCNAVIRRADHALYRAKQLGRNRVCCLLELSPETLDEAALPC